MASVGGIKAGQAYVSILSDDSPLRRGLKGIEAQFKSLGNDIGGVGAQIGGVGAAMAGIGTAGLAALAWPLQMASNMEQTEAQFTTMLKDVGAARALLGDLQEFAASTPFEFPELADAGRMLLAFGSSAGNVKNELRAIGDISSAIGAPIGEIAEIYGKARVQGRLFAEDINQLTGRGIPVIQELAKQFGVTDQEVKKLVEDGQVSFTNLEQAFRDLTTGTGKFAGGMETASKTMAGLLSTLRDNIGAALRPFGEALLPVAKQAVGVIGGIVAKFGEWAKANKQIVVPIAAALAGVVAIGGAAMTAGVALIGLGSAIGAVGTVAGAVSTVVGLVTAPVLGTIAAVAAGIAYLGVQFVRVTEAAGLLRPALAYIWDGFKTLWGIASQTLGGIAGALSSGQFGKAAEIAWAGVHLATLQGGQLILRGVEHLWDNAGTLTKKFLFGLALVTYRTFSSIPQLAWAALKGGKSLAEAMSVVFAGVFNEDLDLAGMMDPAIKRAEQRLDALTFQASPTVALAPKPSPAGVQMPPMNFPAAPARQPNQSLPASAGRGYIPGNDPAAHLAYMLGEEMPPIDTTQFEKPKPQQTQSGAGGVVQSSAELLLETNRILRRIEEAGGLA